MGHEVDRRWEVAGPRREQVGSEQAPVRSVRVTVVGGEVEVVAGGSRGVVAYDVAEATGAPLRASLDGDRLSFGQVREPDAPLLDTIKGLLTGPKRRVRLTLTVPAETGVSITTMNAPVRISGLSGDVGVNTASGGVRVADLAGRVDVKTVTAAVEGDALSGDVLVKTVSGASTLAGPMRSSKVATVDGTVTLRAEAASCLITANTVSADVTVVLPRDAGYDVHAASTSGHVVVDDQTLSGSGSQKGGHRSSGDRGVAAKLRSVSGNVVLRRADGAHGPLIDPGPGGGPGAGDVQDDVQDDVRGT